MIAPFVALALNGFREARRNRVSIVLVAFTVASLFSSTLVAETTVYTMARVLTDFGLGMMAVTLVLLAVFLSSSQLTKEIERKTLYLIVSKPISRSLFLIARYAGTVLTLTVLLLAMTAVFLVQVKVYGAEIGEHHLWAVIGLWLELVLVSAVGFLLASFASQITAGAVTLGVYFAGHLSADIYALSERTAGAAKALARGTYYLLPNLSRVNYRSLAAHELSPSTGDALSGALYIAAYAAVLVGCAALIFQRRDFR